MYKHKDEYVQYVYDEMSKMVDSITEEKDDSPIYEDTVVKPETQTFQTIIQAININLQYLTLSLPNADILPEDSKYIHALCKRYMRVYEKTQRAQSPVSVYKVQSPRVFTDKVQSPRVFTDKVLNPRVLQASNSLLENSVCILQNPKSQKSSAFSKRQHRNTNTNWRRN